MVELPAHPWYLACQFHPEFLSRPLEAHPIFKDFVRASLERRQHTHAPTPGTAESAA